MIREVVPFRHWHYEWLGVVHEPSGFVMSPQLLNLLEQQYSRTLLVGGNVVACAGTIQHWPTRHTAWALLGRGAERNLKWITQVIRANLATLAGRIEFTVRADFPAGQKWAGMLGFRVETPLLPMYGPEGEDHVGFVRIN